MLKKIRFFIKNIFRIFIETIVAFITIRDEKIVLVGLRTPITKLNSVSKDYFMHNTKYLFLKYAHEKYPFKFIYICDDKNMRKRFEENAFKNICSRKSLKGIYYLLRAKFWLYDDAKYVDISNSLLSGGATCINFWHGTSWKKIGFDDNENFQKRSKFLQKVQKSLAIRDDYLIANNNYEVNVYNTAFLIDKDNIPILGSPRLDVLYHDIENAELFMEEDFNKIKSLKKQGKKILIYMPTFRDTGKDISGWLKSNKLKQFLKDNNAVLVCKLHFADKNALSFEQSDELYKMNGQSDMYPILKYTDGLITDYSSIALDYLLIDKPIIYYPADLKEYQEQCRGFYVPYDEFVAGEKVFNEEQLINSINSVIKGIDEYKEQRKKLRDKMFVYQDGKNCERFIEWLKNLNKKGK